MRYSVPKSKCSLISKQIVIWEFILLVAVNDVSSNGNGPFGFTIDTEKHLFGGCKKHISLKIGEVTDTITVDCEKETDRTTVNTDLMAIGNILYTDNTDYLYMVKGGKCEKRTYKEDGDYTTREFSGEECMEIKLKIKKINNEPSDMAGHENLFRNIQKGGMYGKVTKSLGLGQ